MSISRILGILLLVGGIALMVVGYYASQSAGDSIRTFFGADLSKETLWYLIGGGAAVVAGILVLVVRR
ncbi:DUF3185 family protein [uncultured Sphaerochaeta sp.]|uniref:DUF3185 family protein n=1 Tax=uncultured Sphaerochaeta sp. TaxID=886478 RepID=UPI002A0A3C92|nr:DUF3185 family protein [uncultured Sphaerochaeta sp.]